MNKLSEFRGWARQLGERARGARWFPGGRFGAVGPVLANVLTLAVTVYAFWVLNDIFLHNGTGYDETFFVWGGWSIRRGLALYRDFLELKPPMLFLTHAASQLFGVKNFGFRVFFALFPLASLLAVQIALLHRRVNRWLALATVLGITALFVNPSWHDTALSDSESIGLSYYLLGLSFCLWQGRFLKATTAIGGFFLGCAVLSKEPYLLIVAPTWLALFVMRTGPEPPRPGLFAKWSLLGAGVLVLALSVYMIPTGAMKAYVQMVLRYAAIHRDPKTSICTFMGNAESRTLPATVAAWTRVFLNENVIGYLLPIAAPGLALAFRRSKLLFVLALLVVIGSLKAATIGNCPWRHYYVMAMAGAAFVLVVSVDSATIALQSVGSSLGTTFGVAALVLMGAHVLPLVSTARAERHGRASWGEPQPGLLKFIAQNTKPSDRIFTTGNPLLYVQTGRLSAVRESSFGDELLASYPGATDKEKLRPIYDELVRNKPKVVFLDPEYEERRTRFNQTLLMPFLAELKYKPINDRLYLLP